MAKKSYSVEEIIKHLRTIEIEAVRGVSIEDACRKIGVPHQNYYRWKKEYGCKQVDTAKTHWIPSCIIYPKLLMHK